MFSLGNKIALVTGGASGIGAAIAQAFRDQGAIVTIADLHPSADLPLDVASPDSVTDLFARFPPGSQTPNGRSSRWIVLFWPACGSRGWPQPSEPPAW